VAVRSLTIAKTLDLLEVRARSLYALTANVFLHRVRRLVYDKTFADPRYDRKIIANLIYELAGGTKRQKAPEWLTPSSAMQACADRATAMATTLWFDEPGQLPDLVACGQCTMCYCLLRHITGLQEEGGAYPPEVREVFDRAFGFWGRLQQDPKVLLTEAVGATC